MGKGENNLPKWAAPVLLEEAEGVPFRVLAGPNGSIQGPCEAKWGYTTQYVADWNHDGLLDITMIRSGSRTRLMRLFPTVFKGTHVDLDEVITDRARTVTISSPGINAYADGEYACPLPVEISAVPGALTILLPAP